jgi:hypothetical protein
MLILTKSISISNAVSDKEGKEERHKERFFVTSTPEAQTRRLPRLVHLLFRPLPHFCPLIGHTQKMVCFYACTTESCYERVSASIANAPRTMTLLGCQLLNIDHGLKRDIQ